MSDGEVRYGDGEGGGGHEVDEESNEGKARREE